MNAVIYARYSSHNQTEQSIEGQLRDCYEYAKRHELTIVGEYIDRAISGTTDDREEFQRMIHDASKKQFQRILVWKLDRFARNRYDSAMYKHKLKQYGVKVISVMENVGEGDESILLEALLEASAEYYSLDLKKKIRRGMRESILKGQYVGGVIPYGYFVDPSTRKLCIVEQEAEHLRHIFAEYARGVSAAKIVDDLTRRGIRSKRGVPFSVHAIARMLKNKKYIGIYTHDRQEVEGGCPAIIDEDTFNRVQDMLAIKKRTGGGQARAKADYLLSGKVYCGTCGAPMIGDSGKGKNGTVYYYYSCAQKKKSHSCPKHAERKGFLEWYVTEQTVEYVLDPDRVEYIAGAIIAQYEKEFDRSGIRSLETRIGQIEGDIQSAIDMCIKATSEAVQSRFLARAEELSKQKEDMVADLSRLRIAAEIRYTKEEIAAWLRSFCRGELMDEEFRERILDTFVHSVILYDDRLIIYYNINGGEQASYIGPEDEAIILCEDNEKGTRISDASVDGGALIQANEIYYIIGKHFFGLSVPIKR